MDEKEGMPSEQELKEFMGLGNHEARCSYFHAHPSLARIYRAAHFPKPNAAETVQPTPTQK